MVNSKEKTKKGKKAILIATSSIVALCLNSCSTTNYRKTQSTRNNVYYTTDNTISDTHTDLSSVIEEPSENTTISSEPSATDSTEHIDGVGDVIAVDYKPISIKEFSDIYHTKYIHDFCDLGCDNPFLLNEVRKYFDNDSLTIEELGYLQPENFKGNDVTGNINDRIVRYEFRGYYMNFVRYILAENGLRVMIDEIPYSLFETYFPDYIEMHKQGVNPIDYYLCQNPYGEMSYIALGNGDTDYIRSLLSMNDEASKEILRYLVYQSMLNYNSDRYLIATLDSEEIGFIPIMRSIDGKNVLAPNRYKFSQLQDQINRISGFENIDISTPETYEDLVNSGVDIELMEEVFHYSGIDIPSLSQGEVTETDDQQRTRGTTTP